MAKGKTFWIYGRHACLAALQNDERIVHQTYVADKSAADYQAELKQFSYDTTSLKNLEKLLPPHAVHQGIAMQVSPLDPPDIEDVAATGKTLLILDQVSDPHNVGAIFRSAAAFNVGAIITQDRHSPTDSAVMVKTACGAMEMVAHIAVSNISQAMETLQGCGYWCIGLDGEARMSIAQLDVTQKTALILGAEGKGLRSLTSKRCDGLVKLPMHPQMESLNVSNAAAIALYDLYSRRG
jgi:23S rRNA (guanosine2251-2'-O)-methyltransferase